MAERQVIPSDDDGYSIGRFVKAEPGLHEDFRFSFRPTGPLERIRHTNVLQSDLKGKPEEQEFAIAEFVAKKIVSWSLEEKPSASAILRIRSRPLYKRIFDIVFYGIDGGDTDPEESNSAAVDDVRRRMDASMSGETVANSEAAKNA